MDATTPVQEAVAVDDPGVGDGARRRLDALQDSATAKAAGLAAATMAGNLIAVVFTMVFTRLLGADGYGSLAALLNLTIILFVAGSALQVAAAREGTLGRLGQGPELAATLARWSLHIVLAVIAVAVVSILLRAPLAALVNVDHEWAAAAVAPTAMLWLLLCVQRGLLQAAQAYRAVGLSVVLEAFGRLAVGLAFVALGAGVTGAYLGTAASFVVTAIALELVLRRRLGRPDLHTRRHPLTALARDAALPIAALTLVAALQNVDVIMAKHTLDDDTAGVYAAATVAAKALVWIAVGLGMWVLPEATRRTALGQDPRQVLLRAFAVIAVIAAPALLAYALVPKLVLRIAFGSDYESGDEILLALGVAYALLAIGYVTVQFLLGLRRKLFIAGLAVAAVAEPILLAGVDSATTFARVVLLVQAVAAASLLLVALTQRPRTVPAAG